MMRPAPRLVAPPPPARRPATIANLIPFKMPGRTRATDVINVAAACFGVGRDDVIGHNRQAKFVLARHAAMFVAHELTGNSFPQLAKLFGGRDHTTILSACRKAKAQRHPKLQAAIEELLAALKNAAAEPVSEGGKDAGCG
jgi:chromosomal replication initiator protein